MTTRRFKVETYGDGNPLPTTFEVRPRIGADDEQTLREAHRLLHERLQREGWRIRGYRANRTDTAEVIEVTLAKKGEWNTTASAWIKIYL